MVLVAHERTILSKSDGQCNRGLIEKPEQRYSKRFFRNNMRFHNSTSHIHR